MTPLLLLGVLRDHRYHRLLLLRDISLWKPVTIVGRRLRVAAVESADAARAAVVVVTFPWLPDGYSQIFRLYVFGPSGWRDYGSATLRCKI